eukprot:scaffold54040_cov19-Tisochrysis_lutea.AAC.1
MLVSLCEQQWVIRRGAHLSVHQPPQARDMRHKPIPMGRKGHKPIPGANDPNKHKLHGSQR